MVDMRLDDRGVRVVCAACGRSNRLPYATLDKQSRCGHCKTPLPPPGSPVEVPDAAAFEAAAANSVLPLVVDYWAPWCGPCRMVAPELEKVAQAHAGRWLIVKVNTEELEDLGARQGIRSIPTLAVVHRGRELARVAGARPAAAIAQFVQETIASAASKAS